LNKKILILDTSAFIGKFFSYFPETEYVTVPEILNEILNEKTRDILEAYIQTKKIKIESPSLESIVKIEHVAKETGDLSYISETDKKLLALALDYKEKKNKVIIVTDDYSIQNIAKRLGVEFVSLLQKGIKFLISWEIYCPACKKKFPPDYTKEICDVCGEKIKRKAVKKKLLGDENNEKLERTYRKG